jgi:hypothetical protein
MSMPRSPIAARMMLRPIRPNPLIPTLMAIYDSSSTEQTLIVMNGLRAGQTTD